MGRHFNRLSELCCSVRLVTQYAIQICRFCYFHAGCVVILRLMFSLMTHSAVFDNCCHLDIALRNGIMPAAHIIAESRESA